MKIAIFSDSHDNIWKLEHALERTEDVDQFIHCGDLCSPFVVKQLGIAAQGRPIHIVWGNNDGDLFLINKVASGFQGIHLHGQVARITLDDVRVAVNHYPEIARSLAASGDFDLVCYGHDHTRNEERIGACQLVNPGEIMGMNGSATFALFDTDQKSLEFFKID